MGKHTDRFTVSSSRSETNKICAEYAANMNYTTETHGDTSCTYTFGMSATRWPGKIDLQLHQTGPDTRVDVQGSDKHPLSVNIRSEVNKLKTALTMKAYKASNSEPAALLTAKGKNGGLELYESKLRITRTGFHSFISQGMKGDKDILVSQISSIQFKGAGSVVNGYIQVGFLGGSENKGGVLDATRDENTVMFTAAQQVGFMAMKVAIEERMGKRRESMQSTSPLDELEKLAGLRERGILNEEEFVEKKRQLLAL